MTITGSIQIARISKIKGGRTGRRDYGRLYTLTNGLKIYLAKRKIEEMFRCGKKDISEAVRENVAEWAIDDETIINLRIEVVHYVGVCVEETGDVYLAPMSYWLDPDKFTYRNYESRDGSLQRYMRLDHFRKWPALTNLTAKAANKRMKKRGWV